MVTKYKINYIRDEEAAVWIATCDEIPGLILESEDICTLKSRVKTVLSDFVSFEDGFSRQSFESAIEIYDELVESRVCYEVDAYIKIGDNTAAVVNATEGTFANRSSFYDEDCKLFKIISVAMCSGVNVNRNKTSILVEGDFHSKKVYLDRFC